MTASNETLRPRSNQSRARTPSKDRAALERFVHRPPTTRPGAALVVALHGCTQSAHGYARDAGWLDLADREGFVVLAPGQTRAGNPNLCFNWFTEHHGGAGGEEVLAILSMIDDLIASDGLDRARVFVTGLSAGGALAFALLTHHPQVFAGGGVIAGLPAGEARNMGEALARMRGQATIRKSRGRTQVALAPGQAPRLSIWQGTADPVVSPINADRIADQWIDLSGLAATPTRAERNGTRRREVWTDPTGSAVLEVNRLTGFGHATPLATGGPDGVGRAAPHMVECGHSSTRQLAQFWGLVDAPPSEIRDWTADLTRSDDTGTSAPTSEQVSFGAGLRGDIVAGLDARVPNGVRDLIDRTLRQAGL